MHIIFVSRQFGRHQDALQGFSAKDLVLVVDVDRCIACGACALACRAEHGGFGQENVPVRRIIAPAPPDQKTPRVIGLPTSCRQCPEPCACSDAYSFWTICPGDKAARMAETSPACTACEERLLAGMAPACVTRCCMKCLYAGRPEDVLFVLEEKRLRGMGETRIC